MQTLNNTSISIFILYVCTSNSYLAGEATGRTEEYDIHHPYHTNNPQKQNKKTYANDIPYFPFIFSGRNLGRTDENCIHMHKTNTTQTKKGQNTISRVYNISELFLGEGDQRT